MKKIFFLIFLCAINFAVAQKKRTINGVVMSKKERITLVGATVIEVGTNRGVITDLKGTFSLSVKKENAQQLRVSYIGYRAKTIAVTNKNYYEIYLEQENNVLDEVVVTSSYGTKKLKQEVVGSIVTINSKDLIKEQPAVSFDELLEGQVAGLLIETSPELGEAVSIDIRGQGSLTSLTANNLGTSTQPLIIVDGVILSEEITIEENGFFDSDAGSFSENLLNPLAKIGIEDIASINVLKDAAAVGLYGADGANGIILVTTKSGKKGKLKFNASVQTGVSTAINTFKYLSGEQYQEVINSFYTNNNELENIQTWNGVNTNWYDLLNTSGTYHKYNVGASGGKGNWLYRANIGYQVTDETQVENSYKKMNTSLSMNYNNDKFSFSLRTLPSYVLKNSPNTLYNYALPANISPYDEDGNYTFFATYGNPLAVANQNINQSKTLGLINSLKLEYKVLPKLKLSAFFGIDYFKKNEDKFYNGLNSTGQISTFSDLNNVDTPYYSEGTSFGRRLLRERISNKWNLNTTAFYENTFKENHNFDAILGLELRKGKVDFEYQNATGFENYETPQAISSGENITTSNDSSINTSRSVFSQFNYNFKDTYFALLNFRVDQSSVFGDNKDTAINGGLGFSWNVSNASFFNSKVIDFLRVRTSLGTTGNSRIGSYSALGLYRVNDDDNDNLEDDDFTDGYNQNDFANTSTAPNPNLSWETNIKFNIGLDINFLNRFQFTGEYFRDNIKNMIISRDAIPETGFANVQINGADMYNEGVELSVTTKVVNTKNFQWKSSVNFTKIKNKVTHLEGLGSEFSSAEVARAQRIGYATSTLWGFDFVGIDTATGNELYNIEGNIYDGAYVDANFDATDWKPIGDTQPDFYGGINNNFSYKKISLNIAMSYTSGADILLERTLLDHYNILFNRNVSVNVYEDAWREQGDIASYPAITKNRSSISNASKYVFDTSHIKLKSINLGYAIPVENSGLQSFNLFVNASNLGYWYKSTSESGKNGVAEYRNTYPEARTISLGVNAKF